MKFKATLILLTGLLAGCVKPATGDFCDVASPIRIANMSVLNHLLSQDRDLVVSIVAHNETMERLCGISPG